jgi:hypothetical protein
MKTENPSAFPSKEIDYRESAMQGQTVYHDQEMGMTLRDYFAAKAMQSLISKINVSDEDLKYSDTIHQIVPVLAYQVSDEMLKVRMKPIKE